MGVDAVKCTGLGEKPSVRGRNRSFLAEGGDGENMTTWAKCRTNYPVSIVFAQHLSVSLDSEFFSN